MTEFEKWVEKLVWNQYGGVYSGLSDKLGVTLSALKRSVRKGSMSVESLLRLSIEGRTPPSDVLRMAGKGDIADLIERLYGPAKSPLPASATDAEREVALRRVIAQLQQGLVDLELLPRTPQTPEQQLETSPGIADTRRKSADRSPGVRKVAGRR